MGDWEVILQLGAEGGSVTLYGMETERGWLFYRDVSDWSPELIGEERIQHKSPVVDSWDAAVALLDQYPWPKTFSFDGSPGVFGANLVCSTRSA